MEVCICECEVGGARAVVACLIRPLSQALRNSIMEEVDKRLSFGLAYSQLLSDHKIKSWLPLVACVEWVV